MAGKWWLNQHGVRWKKTFKYYDAIWLCYIQISPDLIPSQLSRYENIPSSLTRPSVQQWQWQAQCAMSETLSQTTAHLYPQKSPDRPSKHWENQIIVLGGEGFQKGWQTNSDCVWFELHVKKRVEMMGREREKEQISFSVLPLVFGEGKEKKNEWEERTLKLSTTPNAHMIHDAPSTDKKNAMLPSTVLPNTVHQRNLPIRRPTIDACDSHIYWSAFDRLIIPQRTSEDEG